MTSISKKPLPPTERATALVLEHQAGSSWRDLARKYQVPAGTLCRFAKSGGEYIPRHYSDQLDIDAPLLLPAPACPKCGQVHVLGHCIRRDPLPDYVNRAADFLQAHEKPVSLQVYGRGGRRQS